MVRVPAMLAGLLAAGLPALAIDFGTLRLYTPAGQSPYAEITLSDSAPIDAADIRARIATRDAYGVAGMRYLPALQQISITPQSASNGQVVLRLERLPDPATAPEIDLLLLVGDRMSLSLGEYRVNLSGAGREFAAAPAGARLTSAAPATGAQPATAAPVVSGNATSVATAPSAQPGLAKATLGEAQAAIEAWADAWSRRDMDAYVAAYVPNYSGRNGSHADWVEHRRSRIVPKRKITVDIDKPQFVARGDKVIATFTQRYRGDAYAETSRKRLHLVRGQSGWLIEEEEELQ
ncbi:hypothetical protein [Piscinibacter sakaiensis]|uniref:FimV/HubP-related protein n=1 Tax=Piscinibacter sakaiensis TaxID=1547922 RepID=UPI003AAD8921